VTEVARRFDVSRALLWTWRSKAMAELAAEMGQGLCHCASRMRPRALLLPRSPFRRHRDGIGPRGRLRLQSGGPGSEWKALSIAKFCVRCWT
jgi:hypothetical protein